MTLQEQLKARIQTAMRSGNVIERDILRVVVGEINTLENSSPQNGKQLTTDQIYKIIRKLVIGNTETLQHQTGDRVTVLEQQNVILESLLPKLLSEDEIRFKLTELYNQIVACKSVGQACGLAMKHFKEQGDSVDGNAVKAVVESIKTNNLC
jgi:uncharacterized protein YqeY